ncbi:hypothetical protein H0H81_012057 [Sphagnurus paluster]|uniref:Uncharacterized protein n=1 Tax=Sphagnurus paluster TaxID=117069 RepID=A0A9P7FNA6_9AGAR|nr:hypothetical protein H0H81_012057 [Sphagnurus paluster]
MLTRGANEARSNDICAIKKNITEWLNQSSTTTPHIDPDDHSKRGLKHNTTGLLCPIELDWDNLEVQQKIHDCNEGYDVSESMYPRLLYKAGKGDPEDVEKGIFRNPLLVKVFLAIFTSLSSAKKVATFDVENPNDSDGSEKKTHKEPSSKAIKSNVAQKLNLNKVTPCTIAYSAVILHFLLSDAMAWKSMHNGFNYELFYNLIVDYFEDAEGDQAKECVKSLLAWWNRYVLDSLFYQNEANIRYRQIFPKCSAATAASRASIKKLCEQRACRKAGAGAKA